MMRTALVIAFVGVLAGCGGGAGPESGSKPMLRFAVIPKALDIPVFNYAKIGADRAAAELGNVQVLWNAPARADELKQKEILESYITQKVDGIAIAALNADFLTQTINRAIGRRDSLRRDHGDRRPPLPGSWGVDRRRRVAGVYPQRHGQRRLVKDEGDLVRRLRRGRRHQRERRTVRGTVEEDGRG